MQASTLFIRGLIFLSISFHGYLAASHGSAFGTHARIVFDSLAPPFKLSYDEEFVTRAAREATNSVPSTSLFPGQEVSASHAAFANTNIFDFMGAGVSALSVPAGQSLFIYASGTSNVLWRDVTYVPGSGSGSAIRLNFEVEGDVRIEGKGSRSSVQLGWATKVEGWNAGPGGNSGQAVVQLSGAGFDEDGGDDEITDIVGWDSFNPTLTGFIGTLHIDVPYDDEYGGYSWALSLFTSAYTNHTSNGSSSAFAASLRSVGITAVTDLDNNPIVGATFDSGLAAIPEPSCGLLLSLIVFGRVGFSRSVVRKTT